VGFVVLAIISPVGVSIEWALSLRVYESAARHQCLWVTNGSYRLTSASVRSLSQPHAFCSFSDRSAQRTSAFDSSALSVDCAGRLDGTRCPDVYS
jgi:hypothetical protein